MQSVLWMPVVLFVLALVAAGLALASLQMSHSLGWSHRCPSLGLALSIGYVIALPDLMLTAYTNQIEPTPRYYAWFGLAAASLAMVILTTRAYIARTQIARRLRQRRPNRDRIV